MALILSFDTATPICSVALHQKGELMASSDVHIDKSHASLLSVLIDEVLAHAQVSIREIDAIAVGAGPGSYTGLRIGVSTAKGLCYGLKKPLLSISSLETMIRQVARFRPDWRGVMCPMLDARRMEVYHMLSMGGAQLHEPSPIIVEPGVFDQYLENQKVLFFGDGMPKCRDLLSAHEHSVFIEEVYPSAVSLGFLAYEKYVKQEFEDLAYYEPDYLKEFQGTKAKGK